MYVDIRLPRINFHQYGILLGKGKFFSEFYLKFLFHIQAFLLMFMTSKTDFKKTLRGWDGGGMWEGFRMGDHMHTRG